MMPLTITGFTPEDMLTAGVAAGGLGALVVVWVIVRAFVHRRGKES